LGLQRGVRSKAQEPATLAPKPHLYDAPCLEPKEFLLAVIHDPTTPFHVRMDAAVKVAPYVAAEPIESPRVSAIAGYKIEGFGTIQ
jgi:hypothetical protein